MDSKILELFENYNIYNNSKYLPHTTINEKNGTINTYLIFKGILLAFIDINDYESDEKYVQKYSDKRILEINHCCNGRYLYETNKKITYFRKGDLCISIFNLNKSKSEFPLGYYNGLEILIDIDMANQQISKYIPNFSLIDLYNKLSKEEGFFLIKSNAQIDHIISEIYNVNEEIKETYFKLKIIELLLFFSITDFPKINNQDLSINHAKIIEDVTRDLINNLSEHITIDQLAEKYSISPTTLKNSFKKIYGKPIFQWQKEYKLDYACKLLNEGNYNINEISEMIGYKSSSNFAKSFKKYMGCSPSQYRKY